MKKDSMVQAAESAEWPLCCSYVLVTFKTLSVQVWKEGGGSARSVWWAIGVLSDGQYEQLGVWVDAEATSDALKAALQELKGRGVEQIQFVMSDEVAVLQADFTVAYPQAKLLLSPPRRRCAVLAGAVAARELQRHAGESVRRHGCFHDMGSASAFVAQALIRAEHRGSGIMKAAGSVKRVVVGDGRAGSCSTSRASAPI